MVASGVVSRARPVRVPPLLPFTLTISVLILLSLIVTIVFICIYVIFVSIVFIVLGVVLIVRISFVFLATLSSSASVVMVIVTMVTSVALVVVIVLGMTFSSRIPGWRITVVVFVIIIRGIVGVLELAFLVVVCIVVRVVAVRLWSSLVTEEGKFSGKKIKTYARRQDIENTYANGSSKTKNYLVLFTYSLTLFDTLSYNVVFWGLTFINYIISKFLFCE